MVTDEERLDQHDNQIAAIRDRVPEGMRLVMLQAFIRSRNRGGNGQETRKGV